MKKITAILILFSLVVQIFAVDIRVGSLRNEWSQNDTSFTLVATIFSSGEAPQHREPFQVLYMIDVGDRFAGNVRQEFINGGIEIVNSLADTDFFGIILYNEYSFTLLPLSEIGAIGRERIRTMMSEISTERRRLRDPLSALDRVVAEFSQNQGRRSDGRVLVMTVLGETMEDGHGNAYDMRFAKKMNNLGVSVFTVGHGDDFDEIAAISVAEATGGRAYFVGQNERADILKTRFASIAYKITTPHSKNISIDFITRDAISPVCFGDSVLANVRITRISTNDTINLFFDARNRPRRSSDIDIDFQYDDISMRANLSGNSSFRINLTRGTSEFSPSAPRILRHKILLNLARSIDQLKIGDRNFRRDYAEGFRRMLETRLGPIRNEINTREIQQVFMEMVSIHDMIAGGTASNAFIAKYVRYQLHYSRFSH